MNNKALCIIPARMASTRFPGKPLCLIKGKPMIQWVYERVSMAGYPTFVATEHENIVKAVENFGGRAVMTSSQCQTGTDRVNEAALKIISSENIKPVEVINVQGDEPLIHPAQVRQLAEAFNPSIHEILTLAVPVTRSVDELAMPDKCHVVRDKSGRALYFSRLVIPYTKSGKPPGKLLHLGIYAYRLDVLGKFVNLPPSVLELSESLEQNRWIENGGSIHVLDSPFMGTSIDTPEDLKKLESYLAENPDVESDGLEDFV